MKSFFRKLALVLVGLICIGFVFLTFWPTASIYLFSPGLIGGDSLHMLHFTQKFSLERVSFPPAGWTYKWFEGVSYIDDIPWLNFYLIQPLVGWVGVFAATKIYFVGAIFVFLIFSYLLFYRLSKNIFLSLALTIALSRSYAIYVQLYSAGVGLSSVAQIVLPASLYFLIGCLEGKKRFLGWAILALAFGFYTHDLLTILFGFIPSLMFLFFSFSPGGKFLNWVKIKQILILVVGVLLISLPAYIYHLVNFLSGHSTRTVLFLTPQSSPVKFSYLFNSTNLAFFVFFFLALILAPLFNPRRKMSQLLPLFLILMYILVFQLSYDLVINPLVSTVFPHRFHWVLPLILGAIIAVFFRLEGKIKLLKSVLTLTLSIGIIIISFLRPSFMVNSGIETTIESLKHQNKQENLFTELEPSFQKHLENITNVSLEMIDDKDINHRVYAANPGFRLAWNLIYNMPQTHGYWHYHTPRSDNWFAWLYATFSYENFEEGGIPADIAQQQALFLADWYAVRYLITAPKGEAAVAPHFYQDQPYVKNKSADKGPALIELSPDYFSPIARATDEPVIGFIGKEQAYDNFMRNLGMLNLNSNYLIPIRAANFVEDLTADELARLDGLVIYDYRKKGSSRGYQEAWSRLEQFIQKGGFVWVETGGECPEGWGEQIPATFPVSQLERGSLGTSWQVETDFYTDFDFKSLAPLTYKEGTWNVSFVPSESGIKPEARVLLRQVGKAVIVASEKGKGKIVWSGLNLFYRPLHHSGEALAEVELQKRIYQELISFDGGRIDFEFSRPKPEKVVLNLSGAHGALLKENNYGGWTAYAQSGGERVKLPVLAAGPDFMYAPLPKRIQNQPVTVEFIYQGRWFDWLVFVIVAVAFIFLLDLAILNQRIFNFFFLPIKAKVNRTRKRVKESWEEA